jgi:hypothetical protein
MHCIKCGTALLPEGATCSACGTPTPYNVTSSVSEVSSAKEASAVSDSTVEEKTPSPSASQAEDTPPTATVAEHTVLEQSPQPDISSSQTTVEQTVLEQPSSSSAAQQIPVQQGPQPAPSPSFPAWQQSGPFGQQASQPGASQPWPGAQVSQGQPWPQPFPGQPPQGISWQPQPGTPHPIPRQQQGQQSAAPQAYPVWQQPQPGVAQPPQGQPWPQPFPGQLPQARLWQPQPGAPQPLSWPQPFPGQPQPIPAWQQPQPGMSQSLPSQQEARHRGLSLAMALLLIIIAIVIISGSGLIYYVAAAHPADLQAQATTVAQSFLTEQAQHMSPQGIYAQATSGKPTINDTLSNPANSTWHNSSTAQGSCAFSQGAFHITVQGNFVYFCHSQMRFSNFAFQVQMTIIKGTTGGLIFRANESPLLHYLFGIHSSGFYIFDVLTSSESKLLSYGPSAAIKTESGQPNLLTVIARGSTMYLYINKQFVANAQDSTYSSGQIGLFATNQADSTNIAFSNVQVWAL